MAYNEEELKKEICMKRYQDFVTAGHMYLGFGGLIWQALLLIDLYFHIAFLKTINDYGFIILLISFGAFLSIIVVFNLFLKK